jgi:citrate lyase subunit beta/citryl-CoA lyase
VRSDLWVAVELRDSGGLELELTSKVEPYYGEAIREQVGETLAGLGVADARVEIDDRGALPFVIAARLEAAAVAAGAAPSEVALPAAALLPSPSPRDRLRRSRLYLPGSEPKYLINAGLYGPDAVILDLEDSVHPDEKASARLLVRNALRAIDFGAAERMVRINQLPLGLDDLDVVLPAAPDLILLPKVETADEVAEVSRAIDERVGGAQRPLWLMPILETARGIENSYEIARASARVAALTIGLEDYAADLGVPRSADGEESIWARRRLINAAKAAGVQAIDSVYGQVDDLDGLRAWAERSKRAGFEGMGCLHPRQIRVIHAAFDPRPREIERALRIVAAFERAQAAGLGVVSLGSKMIDPPVVEQARRLVDRARVLGLIGEEDERS